MNIRSIEFEGRKITYPENLSPPEPNDPTWIDSVGDYWLEKRVVWQRDFDNICKWGDDSGPPTSGQGLNRRLLFLRSQIRNLFCKNSFSTFEHEEMFNSDRRHYSKNAVSRAVYFGAFLITIFEVVLVILFPTKILTLSLSYLTILIVIGLMNWYAATEQPRRNLRLCSSVAGMVVTALLWFLPTLLESPDLERTAFGCLILLTFFMAAVMDLGRMTMTVFSGFALSLVIFEPWMRMSQYVPEAGSQTHIYRVLLMVFTGLIAILTAYRRGRARRIIFALEQQTNMLLYYCHTREASTLPEPDEPVHSVVNSS